MPDVPGMLPDHVHADPAHRHPAQPLVRHRVIVGEARRDPSRFSAGLTELGDNVSDGLVVTDVPARAVTPGIPGDLLGWPPGQIMPKPGRAPPRPHA